MRFSQDTINYVQYLLEVVILYNLYLMVALYNVSTNSKNIVIRLNCIWSDVVSI